MKKLEFVQMERLQGGERPASYAAGLFCTTSLLLAFTPAAPLALAYGYGCIISVIGISLGH